MFRSRRRSQFINKNKAECPYTPPSCIVIFYDAGWNLNMTLFRPLKVDMSPRPNVQIKVNTLDEQVLTRVQSRQTRILLIESIVRPKICGKILHEHKPNKTNDSQDPVSFQTFPLLKIRDDIAFTNFVSDRVYSVRSLQTTLLTCLRILFRIKQPLTIN